MKKQDKKNDIEERQMEMPLTGGEEIPVHSSRDTQEILSIGEKIINYKPKGARNEAIEIIHDLAGKLKQHMEKSKILEEELEKTNKILDKFKKQNKELEDKNNSLMEELKNKTSASVETNEKLQQEKNELEENFNKLKEDFETSKETIEKFESENNSFRKENALQKENIMDLEKKLDEEMERSENNLKNMENQHKGKICELRKFISYLEEEVEELTEANKLLNNELSTYVQEVKANEESWSDIQETLKSSFDM